MNKTTFGRTGFQVTPLGFGGAEVGQLEIDQERVTRILNLLLDRGVNVIDTAATYAGSQELIGKAISHRRGEYVLISKCGQKLEGLEGEAWSAKVIGQTVDRALRRLRTDRLDVMLLHTCDLATLQKGEAIGALVKAREAGKIAFAGYSGDNEAAAYAAAHPEIAVIETSVNICDQVNIDMVLPVTRKHNVGVLAKRPIANAVWRSETPKGYEHYIKVYKDRFARMKLDATALGFSGDAAWSEIALRFTIGQPGVNTAIIGTTSPENTEANIATVAKGALPAGAVEKIRSAFQRAQKEAGAPWTGQG